MRRRIHTRYSFAEHRKSKYPDFPVSRTNWLTSLQVYDVVITLGQKEWRTSIRYNTFRALHHAVSNNPFNLNCDADKEHLRNQMKAKFTIRMPKLPGKKAFGNDQKTFIEKRRVGLQLYLQELLSYEEVRSSEEVASILNLGGRIVVEGASAEAASSDVR